MALLRTTLACALSISLFAVAGCAQTTDDSARHDSTITGEQTTDVPTAPPASEQFKLYPSFDAVPNVTCDRHTLLVLAVDGEATLSETFEGTCDIVVEPDARTYGLTAGPADECGTKTLAGAGTDGAQLVITDNRDSVCVDEGPSFGPTPKLTVEETIGGVTRVLFTIE